MIALALVPRAAPAAGWHYYDPECPIALGAKTDIGAKTAVDPKSMKFVAMQPKKNIDRVCDALPETGQTVIALDAGDAELREMNWDIRVLRDADGDGQGEGADGEAALRLPIQKHRNGMVNFDHNFVEAGKYILFAKLTSDDGTKEYVGRHRFTVGLMDDTEFYSYVFFAGFLLTAGGGLALAMRRKRQSDLEGASGEK